MNKHIKQKWLIKIWHRGEMQLKKEFTIFATEERIEKFIIPKNYRATYEIRNT